MKIAILSTVSNYEWAGTEEVWAQFAQLALKQGHQVCVSAHWRVARSPQVAALKSLGLQVVERSPFRPTRLYLLKERYWSDMDGLRHFQPDVMLINSGSLFDLLNLPALKQFCGAFSVPQVFLCHFVADGFFPHARETVRQLVEDFRGWIFVSYQNQRLAERQLACTFPNGKVIPNTPRFVLEFPLPWPPDEIIQFACVARLETLWKGQDVLLEVLSQPQWRTRAWHLNLYGTGPDADYLRELATFYGLSDRVTLHGYVRDIQSVWSQNHVMVLASRGEGMPLAVLEAMMCGRPTVTTDVGGNCEILSEGVTGFLAAAATPTSFGLVLEDAWKHRFQWLDIGQAAHVSLRSNIHANSPQEILNYIQNILEII